MAMEFSPRVCNVLIARNFGKFHANGGEVKKKFYYFAVADVYV